MFSVGGDSSGGPPSLLSRRRPDFLTQPDCRVYDGNCVGSIGSRRYDPALPGGVFSCPQSTTVAYLLRWSIPCRSMR